MIHQSIFFEAPNLGNDFFVPVNPLVMGSKFFIRNSNYANIYDNNRPKIGLFFLTFRA